MGVRVEVDRKIQWGPEKKNSAYCEGKLSPRSQGGCPSWLLSGEFARGISNY